MGKLLVKWGLWIQEMWCKLQCSWNKLVSKLMFKTGDCPYEECTCKK